MTPVGDMNQTPRPPSRPGANLGTDTIGRDVMSPHLYAGDLDRGSCSPLNVIGAVVGRVYRHVRRLQDAASPIPADHAGCSTVMRAFTALI